MISKYCRYLAIVQSLLLYKFLSQIQFSYLLVLGITLLSDHSRGVILELDFVFSLHLNFSIHSSILLTRKSSARSISFSSSSRTPHMASKLSTYTGFPKWGPLGGGGVMRGGQFRQNGQKLHENYKMGGDMGGHGGDMGGTWGDKPIFWVVLGGGGVPPQLSR